MTTLALVRFLTSRSLSITSTESLASNLSYYVQKSNNFSTFMDLRYALQHRQFNAPYTPAEREQLGYPAPFIPDNGTSYVRYEKFSRIFQPWLERVIVPFIKGKFPQMEGKFPFLFVAEAAFTLFERLLPSTQDPLRKRIVVIRLSQKTFSGRWSSSSPSFIIGLEHPGINCCIIWGARRVNGILQAVHPSSLTTNKLESKLSQAGVVPDRQAIHEFLCTWIQSRPRQEQERLLRVSIPPSIPPIDWNKKVEEVATYSMDENSGSSLYREAIMKWNACFFSAYGLTESVYTLLSSQVAPHLQESSTLVEWALAYQNLCEIVMLCFQKHPEKFSEFSIESVLGRQLDDLPKQRKIVLFPYAMSVVSHILEIASDKKQKVVYTARTYFETVCVLKDACSMQATELQEISALDSLGFLPDVILTEIHPNNVLKESLHPNDVGNQIRNFLTKNPQHRLTLVIDLTLNHWQDPEVIALWKVLSPFIESGQLEIFAIQSLAKLTQLGADNFSGGLSVYCGGNENLSLVSTAPSYKSLYFGFVTHHFQELLHRYIQLIRKNTEFVYRGLLKHLTMIQNLKIEGVSSRVATVTLNSDENTVYVGIRFDTLSNEDLRHLHHLILSMAAQRHLPLTGRQSFGFTLSGLNAIPGTTRLSDPAPGTMRFSIGVESEQTLDAYIELFGDVAYLLTCYLRRAPQPNNLSLFSKSTQKIISVIAGKESLSPVRVQIGEKPMDMLLSEAIIETGSIEMQWNEGQLRLDAYEQAPAPHRIIKKPSLFSSSFLPTYNFEKTKEYALSNLSHSEKIRLLFFLLYSPALICVVVGPNSLRVYGMDDLPLLESRDFERDFIVDNQSHQFSISKEEGLMIYFQGTSYRSNSIYVEPQKELGTLPVRFDKLPPEYKEPYYDLLSTHDLEISLYRENAICIRFQRKKVQVNYLKDFQDRFSMDPEIGAITAYLASLNFDDMPLDERYKWNRPYQNSRTHFWDAVQKFSFFSIFQIDATAARCILAVPHQESRKKIFTGIFQGLCWKLFFNPECFMHLKVEQAHLVAALFEEAFSKDLDLEWNLIIDPKILNNWLEKVEEKLSSGFFHTWLSNKDCPPYRRLQVTRDLLIAPFLTALLPCIKRVYKSPVDLGAYASSTLLKKFAPLCKGVQNHLETLEQALDLTAEQAETPLSVIYLFAVYKYYPLKEERRRSLLDSLKKADFYSKMQALQWKQFVFIPIDGEREEDYPYRTIYLEEEDAPLIAYFFDQIGVTEKLIQSVQEEDLSNIQLVYCAFRLLAMTKDPRLLQALSHPSESMYSTFYNASSCLEYYNTIPFSKLRERLENLDKSTHE